MLTQDPQFLYLVLILPTLFGLTLLGDGINKVVHEEAGGVISLIFGVVFIGVVIVYYFFFSNYLTQQF
jgi:hypothetical protein